MRTRERRLLKAVAAAAGLALVVVLSRHERAAFDLNPKAPDAHEPDTSG